MAHKEPCGTCKGVGRVPRELRKLADGKPDPFGFPHRGTVRPLRRVREGAGRYGEDHRVGRMKTSRAGRELIERNEGLRLKAYQDSVGVWTIGYGDTGPDVVPGLSITKEEASRRLSARLAREFEPGVKKAIRTAPRTQAQFDAMVSLAYNIGVGAFARSSVARYHVAGEYAKAADAFLLWNMAGGVVLRGLQRRRAEERDLYLSGGAVDTLTADSDTASARQNPVELQKDVQRALAAAGDYRGPIDGDPGPLTRQALHDYRARHGG